jgi:hypothetical protein
VGGFCGRWPGAVQRALCLLKGDAWYGLQVNHRGLDIAMSEKPLNCLKVVVSQEQVTGESVPEGVGRDSFCEVGGGSGLLNSALNVGPESPGSFARLIGSCWRAY